MTGRGGTARAGEGAVHARLAATAPFGAVMPAPAAVVESIPRGRRGGKG